MDLDSSDRIFLMQIKRGQRVYVSQPWCKDQVRRLVSWGYVRWVDERKGSFQITPRGMKATDSGASASPAKAS